MKNRAIITAAGKGSRLPGKTRKQFLQINCRPILVWTIDIFYNHPEIDQLIIVLPELDFEENKQFILKEYE